jgi:DNA (cytosine-5)-methyltransferase 1
VVSALECHQPDAAIVENVPRFTAWKLYPAWCSALQALGYAVAPHIVDVADLGVPQHRERVFIALTRSQYPIQLQLPQREHVPAATILDFAAGKWSPIERKGRAAATLARIGRGREQHGARFLSAFYGATKGGRSLSRPIGTITTRDRWAVIDGDRMRMLSVDEARKAMTFPPHYRLPANGREAMHMLGNAVPPAAACDVICALKEAA